MGIRSERVEAGGSRAYDLDTCGRLGRRDERARKALRYIPRSLVSAPAVHHRMSRWRRPAAGWGGRSLICSRGRANGRENPVVCHHGKENEEGVKIIPAQIYAGVDTIRVVGFRFSPESLRVREFLARNRIPHEWLDPDRDAAVDRLLREFAVTPGELPVVIASGSVLRRPTPGVLAEYLGLTIDSLPERCFDLVVVGGGPAGLAAAVYGASEGLRTLVVEMVAVGGQAGPARASRTTSASRPGSPAAISPSGPSCKRRSSAPTSPAHARPRRCVRRPGISWSAFRTGPMSPVAP